MTAKEFLKQYEYADKKARRLKAEYEKELQLIDAIRSASDNDGMPHGTNIGKPVEVKAIRLAEKAMAWKMAELDAIQVRQEVFEVIWNIPGLEGDILYEKYINLLKWEDVAAAVHVSYPTAHKYHRLALKQIEILL